MYAHELCCNSGKSLLSNWFQNITQIDDELLPTRPSGTIFSVILIKNVKINF